MQSFYDAMDPRSQHLSRLAESFVESADCVLVFRSTSFLAHTQVLGLRSTPLAAFLRLALPEAHSVAAGPLGAALPVCELQGLPDALESACSPDSFGLFLQLIYSSGREALEGRKVEDVGPILLLADYFGAKDVTALVEGWLCATLRPVCWQPKLEEGACAALELGICHRLTHATAQLLPWALQRLSYGRKQGVVWYDTQRRQQRIHAALSDQLKAVCLDAFFFSQSGVLCCEVCGCRPEDITPAFDKGCGPWRHSWRESPLALHHGLAPAEAAAAAAAAPLAPVQLHVAGGCPYDRAVAHFVHRLKEGSWGVT